MEVPQHTLQSFTNYVEHGAPPGGFMCAILADDLQDARGRADEANLANLPAIVAYRDTQIPRECWGSRAAMKDWMDAKKEARDKARETA